MPFSFLLILLQYLLLIWRIILLRELFWPFICDCLLGFILHETDLFVVMTDHAVINMTVSCLVSRWSRRAYIWGTVVMHGDLFTTRAILLNQATTWTLRPTPPMAWEGWRLVCSIISHYDCLIEVMNYTTCINWTLGIRGPCVSAHVWLLLGCSEVWIRGLLLRCLLVCSSRAWRLNYVIWVVDGEALDIVVDYAWIS